MPINRHRFTLHSAAGIDEFRRYASYRDTTRRGSLWRRKFRFTCLRYYETHLYLPVCSTYERATRCVHRPSELQQLSPLGDSRCSYLNNIPNSLASLTRDSPASHHVNREYSASFSRDVSIRQRFRSESATFIATAAAWTTKLQLRVENYRRISECLTFRAV